MASIVTDMPMLVIFGMSCSKNDWWVEDFTKEILDALPAAEFFFPPAVGEQLMWHPYTEDASLGETQNATHRAPEYASYIKWTGEKVWTRCDFFEELGEKFGIIAISNGGALGFEACVRYSNCHCVLWQASVPVWEQQELQYELQHCRTGFLFGDYDWTFGGLEEVERVANRLKSSFWTYKGGHSQCSVEDIAAAVSRLLQQ